MKRKLTLIALLLAGCFVWMAPTCQTPSIAPASGTVNNDVPVTITEGGSCSVLCYTTDGTTPTSTSPPACSHGTQGNTPVSLTDTPYTTGTGAVKAIGVKSGSTNSAVATNTYTFTVATPTFSSDGSATPFNNDVSETISETTTGAAVSYCLGTNTCTPGTSYSSSVTLPGAGSWTQGWFVRANATKSLYNASTTATTTNPFTFTVGAVTDAPGAGTYTSVQTATLGVTTTTGAAIHYTIDNSTATCSSTTYTVPLTVNVTEHIRAVACKTNYNTASEIDDLYTINLTSDCNTGSVNLGNGVTCVYSNQAIGSTGGMTTQTVGTGGNVSQHDQVWVHAYQCNDSSCSGVPTTTMTLSDNLNNPEPCFTQTGFPITWVNGTEQNVAWYCPDAPAGLTSFTITCSVAASCAYMTISFSNVTGACTSAPCLDGSGSFNLPGTTFTSLSVSTSSATMCTNDLMLAYMQNNNDEMMTVTAPYLQLQQGASGGNTAIGITVSSTGIQTGTVTWTGNDGGGGDIIAVKTATSVCTYPTLMLLGVGE